MSPRKRNKIKKTYIQATVTTETFNEFMDNAMKFNGGKHGYKGLSLEEAMKLFNNYFKSINNKRLVEVAKEEGLPPWELGATLIEIFMDIHTRLGVSINDMTLNEHYELVKKHYKK